MAIANTFIWVTRDEYANPAVHSNLIMNLYDAYCRSYLITKSLLETKKYDYLLVFNGRFCSSCASVDAANELGTTSLYHERGALPDRFFLSAFMPHDRLNVQHQILSYWHSATLSSSYQAESIARQFFARKRHGDGLAWTSFTKYQKPNKAAKLIEHIKTNNHITGPIATYFASSDHEFVALESSIFPEGPFGDQLESLSMFISSALPSLGHLIIRMHPNMLESSGRYMDEWCKQLALPRKNITLVEPESQVSSYELIDISDVVVVYSSTVGIEAVAAGKPVIQLGFSFYDEIGADIVRPSNISDLVSSVSKALSLKINPRSALPYGYWGLSFGTLYAFFKPSGLHGGTFLGVNRLSLPQRINAAIADYARYIESLIRLLLVRLD